MVTQYTSGRNCLDETSVSSSSRIHTAKIKGKVAFCIFSLFSFVFILVVILYPGCQFLSLGNGKITCPSSVLPCADGLKNIPSPELRGHLIAFY